MPWCSIARLRPCHLCYLHDRHYHFFSPSRKSPSRRRKSRRHERPVRNDVFSARDTRVFLSFSISFPLLLSLSFSLRSLAGRSDEGLPSPSLLRSIVATRRSRRLQLESGTCPRWWTGFATTLAQSPSPMQFFHCDRWSNHLEISRYKYSRW